MASRRELFNTYVVRQCYGMRQMIAGAWTYVEPSARVGHFCQDGDVFRLKFKFKTCSVWDLLESHARWQEEMVSRGLASTRTNGPYSKEVLVRGANFAPCGLRFRGPVCESGPGRREGRSKRNGKGKDTHWGKKACTTPRLVYKL